MKKIILMIFVLASLLIILNEKHSADTEKVKGLVICVTPESSKWACLKDANDILCCYDECQ